MYWVESTGSTFRFTPVNMIWLPVRVEMGEGVTRLCYLLPVGAGVWLEFYNLFLYMGLLKCKPIHVHNTHKCMYELSMN